LVDQVNVVLAGLLWYAVLTVTKESAMKLGTYVDKGVEVIATDAGVQITGMSSNQIKLHEKAGMQLLNMWQGDMKSRGSFLRIVNGVCFRSGEVKSVVRCLRQVYQGAQDENNRPA
jgi:hypothetical protein